MSFLRNDEDAGSKKEQVDKCSVSSDGGGGGDGAGTRR